MNTNFYPNENNNENNDKNIIPEVNYRIARDVSFLAVVWNALEIYWKPEKLPPATRPKIAA